MHIYTPLFIYTSTNIAYNNILNKISNQKKIREISISKYGNSKVCNGK